MIRTASKFIKERNRMQDLSLTSEQTRSLVTAIGANAVLVFTHYIALANMPSPNMEDSQLSKLTGLSEQTVKRTRLALTKLGWFRKETYKTKLGEKGVTYLVGVQAVSSKVHAVSNYTKKQI